MQSSSQEFLTTSGQPQVVPESGGSGDSFTVKVTGGDTTAQFLGPKIAIARGVTKAIIGAGVQQVEVGLPAAPATDVPDNVPLVWNGGTASWGPAAPPFIFPAVQVTNVVPNNSDPLAEVALRSASGYVGITSFDGDVALFAPLGGSAIVTSQGDGKSVFVNCQNSVAAQFTLIEATLTGESNDAPSLGFYGAPPVVQPTISGVTTGTLAQLQAVVRDILTKVEAMGLWVDGTT